MVLLGKCDEHMNGCIASLRIRVDLRIGRSTCSRIVMVTPRHIVAWNLVQGNYVATRSLMVPVTPRI